MPHFFSRDPFDFNYDVEIRDNQSEDYGAVYLGDGTGTAAKKEDMAKAAISKAVISFAVLPDKIKSFEDKLKVSSKDIKAYFNVRVGQSSRSTYVTLEMKEPSDVLKGISFLKTSGHYDSKEEARTGTLRPCGCTIGEAIERVHTLALNDLKEKISQLQTRLTELHKHPAELQSFLKDHYSTELLNCRNVLDEEMKAQAPLHKPEEHMKAAESQRGHKRGGKN